MQDLYGIRKREICSYEVFPHGEFACMHATGETIMSVCHCFQGMHAREEEPLRHGIEEN